MCAAENIPNFKALTKQKGAKHFQGLYLREVIIQERVIMAQIRHISIKPLKINLPKFCFVEITLSAYSYFEEFELLTLAKTEIIYPEMWAHQ